MKYEQKEMEIVGKALKTLNKEVKNLRDCKIYLRGQYGVAADYRKYEKKILNILKIDYKTYCEIDNNITTRKVEEEIKKLYNLKMLVIKKAKEKGIKPKGYHDFIYYGIDGSYNIQSALYIEIGGYGFHYGMQEQRYYDYPCLGTIEERIQGDWDIEYTQEMENILKKFIEE